MIGQESISVGLLVLYIGSFVVTLAVNRINKLIGEKVQLISTGKSGPGIYLIINIEMCMQDMCTFKVS